MIPNRIDFICKYHKASQIFSGQVVISFRLITEILVIFWCFRLWFCG